MQAELLTLLQKYTANIPRYTSYPTALEFRSLDPEFNLEALYQQTLGQVQKVSLYVHLPFCPSLCYFCACNKIITNDESDKIRYLSLLQKEFKVLARLIPPQVEIVQVHLGGGSPSFFSAEQHDQIEKIISQLRLSSDCQKSVEIDPRTFSTDKLQRLYAHGYRRFSLGVQDFDPQVQELVNRIQPRELVSDVVQAIRKLAETSINFDLIYGLPGQSDQSLAATMEQVIELSPDRIALYGYAHVNWRVKVQNVLNKYGIPSALERFQLFDRAAERLKRAGYLYIGMDHFARENDELYVALQKKQLRRNFMGYTTISGQHLLATGVSGISDLDNYILQNAPQMEDYARLLQNGQLAVTKVIKRSEEDRMRAFMIEALMCNRFLSAAELEAVFPNSDLARKIFAQGLKDLLPFSHDGLVELTSDSLQVTELGCFFLRQLATVFDAYLSKSEQRSGRFSVA